MAIQPHQQDDPSIPDPEVFDGLRYYRMRKQEGHANRHQFATTDPYTLHFCHGNFSCPGRFLASNVIKLILGGFLLDFEFRFPPGQGRPGDVRAHEYIFPNPKGRVEIRLRYWNLRHSFSSSDVVVLSWISTCKFQCQPSLTSLPFRTFHKSLYSSTFMLS